MRSWPRREACRCVADGEWCPIAAWSGLVCVACCMQEAESALRSRCMDEARCAARMSVVVGLGLERTPTWSSCGRGGAYFVSPGLSYNAEITQRTIPRLNVKPPTSEERRRDRYGTPRRPGPGASWTPVDCPRVWQLLCMQCVTKPNRIPQIQYINTHVNISQES